MMVNDKIVARFPPDLSVVETREITLEFKDLTRTSFLDVSQGKVVLTIELERPDSPDEEKIHRYVYRAHEFRDRLASLLGRPVEIEIAPFDIISVPQSP